MKPIRKSHRRFPFQEPENFGGLRKQVKSAPFRQVAKEVREESMFLALDMQLGIANTILTLIATEEIRRLNAY